MTNLLKQLLITGPLAIGAILFASADGAQAVMVNCDTPNASIQRAVDNADGPTTIYVNGTCTGDVLIIRDDITLSGNKAGADCDRSFPGGTGTIEGTVTVDGARSVIEFLTITGGGVGVEIVNRATVQLTCNDISLNKASGIEVLRASNAVLVGNTVSGNGAREANPNIYYDSGLWVADASSVLSLGNTYADNQYAAIDIARQSTFRNGQFLPNEPGYPADPDERDVITERGCDPETGAGCMTDNYAPVAIDVFNGGGVDLRNAEVNGEIDNEWQSSFRVDGNAAVQGIIHNFVHSVARLKSRNYLGDRAVTFSGTLQCDSSSQSFYGDVYCGQTCDGDIPGSCSW